MRVISSAFSASYILPSTSLETALVHSKKKTKGEKKRKRKGEKKISENESKKKHSKLKFIASEEEEEQKRKNIPSKTANLGRHQSTLAIPMRCFSPPLNTSLHSFLTCSPPSRATRYPRC